VKKHGTKFEYLAGKKILGVIDETRNAGGRKVADIVTGVLKND
jgi:hypothetical protein